MFPVTAAVMAAAMVRNGLFRLPSLASLPFLATYSMPELAGIVSCAALPLIKAPVMLPVALIYELVTICPVLLINPALVILPVLTLPAALMP